MWDISMCSVKDSTTPLNCDTITFFVAWLAAQVMLIISSILIYECYTWRRQRYIGRKQVLGELLRLTPKFQRNAIRRKYLEPYKPLGGASVIDVLRHFPERDDEQYFIHGARSTLRHLWRKSQSGIDMKSYLKECSQSLDEIYHVRDQWENEPIFTRAVPDDTLEWDEPEIVLDEAIDVSYKSDRDSD
jgi:hypothetical protein